jgi:hypothetical protein
MNEKLYVIVRENGTEETLAVIDLDAVGDGRIEIIPEEEPKS